MLTSMMDMFTIILIFLLCSFSDDPKTPGGVKELELPKSTAEVDFSDSIQIVLSREQLKLNEDIMAQVDKETIVGMDPKNLKASSLYEQLRVLYDETKTSKGEDTKPKHVLFICDKHHSFKTINMVIKTAGLAGYPNFQFAVLEGLKE
jgi:hypothetical protein